ncbi:uncharacterized protein LOC112567494 [Pomacea canaliculata]|uniref:uncharacterized protein LOC112567494 n=1 Tax=Pomacea canaliculata TaxID=400727 RepID=UPI000D72D5B8|nr:uncharacterized protein LOC112567494 [Pomacea canaliculata]
MEVPASSAAVNAVWLLVACFLVLLEGTFTTNGFSSGIFHGMATILQVQCSGETLDADENLLSMALYTLADEVVVVSVDLSSQECTTRGAFSACIIDKQDSRRTAIRTLVQDLPQDGSREYGCDVTSVKPGGRTRIQTWSYTLHNESMYMAFVVQCLRNNGSVCLCFTIT